MALPRLDPLVVALVEVGVEVVVVVVTKSNMCSKTRRGCLETRYYFVLQPKLGLN